MKQTKIRCRRHGHLPVVNDGDWSLRREIADVAGPLAAQVAARLNPLQFRRPILAYADAAHEAAGTSTGWVEERDARTKTAHLAGDEGKRRAAMTLLIDLAPRPALPEITDAMILDGSWVAALIDMVLPVDRSLADLLSKSFPPNANELRGQLSRSEHLDRLLRETVDRATLSLQRALDAADQSPSTQTAKPDPRAELAALGIEV